MKLLVAGDLPREVYNKSSILKPLKDGDLNFQQVAERFRHFSLDSVIFMASACLWHSWHNDEITTRQEWAKTSNLLIQIYGALSVCLGIFYCKRKGQIAISEEEFRILISDIHRLPDSISNKTIKKRELNKLRKELIKYKDHEILHRIPDNSIGLTVDLFRARVAYLQWHTRSFYLLDLSRTWAIFKEVKSTLIKYGIKNKVEFLSKENVDKYEAEFLGTSALRFMRAAWSLFSPASAD